MELVTRIQAVYRGRIARKAFLRQRAAAVRIQVRHLGASGRQGGREHRTQP